MDTPYRNELPLNSWVRGYEFHHLHIEPDDRIGIYIPRDIHRSVYHNHKTKHGMRNVNKVAFEWLACQDVIISELDNPIWCKRDTTLVGAGKYKGIRVTPEIYNRIAILGNMRSNESPNTAIRRVFSEFDERENEITSLKNEIKKQYKEIKKLRNEIKQMEN